MKIEEGKFYRTRSGRKVGPMEWMPLIMSPRYVWRSRGLAWTLTGTCHGDSSNDLIAEWTDTPRTWAEMTDAEKGALLLAHHEGKVIEYFRGAKWMERVSMFFADNVAYRIRPEPKRVTVELCYAVPDSFEMPTIGTIDLIDGKPDPASIKMERIE